MTEILTTDVRRDTQRPRADTETPQRGAPPEVTSPEPCSDDDTVMGSTIHVRPWIDAVIDEHGHDPRSRYVEKFWLGVLGPTATWLLRRLVAGFEHHPDGYDTDLGDTARAMGLSYTAGRSSPFTKALQRCVMFGLAHQTSDGMAVRRRVPTIAHRHLRRMPDAIQLEHESWQQVVTLDGLTRAHQLAVAMLAVGDEASLIEHQLIALGVANATAAEVADNVGRL